MKATMDAARCAALVAAALLGLLTSVNASAGGVLLADSTLVSGTSSDIFSFQAPGPGTVTVNLTNLAWPQPLTSLDFMATTPSAVLSSWSDSGATGSVSQTQYFQVSTAGTYFADITATAGGALDLGVYSFSLTFTPAGSPVPLPASGWLMTSAVLLGMWLLATTHRRRLRRPVPAVAA